MPLPLTLPRLVNGPTVGRVLLAFILMDIGLLNPGKFVLLIDEFGLVHAQQ